MHAKAEQNGMTLPPMPADELDETAKRSADIEAVMLYRAGLSVAEPPELVPALAPKVPQLTPVEAEIMAVLKASGVVQVALTLEGLPDIVRQLVVAYKAGLEHQTAQQERIEGLRATLKREL